MNPSASTPHRSDKAGRSALLAWTLCGLTSLISLINLGVDFGDPLMNGGPLKLAGGIMWTMLPIVLGIVAALIIARMPGNRIGWLLITPAILLAVGDAMDRYIAGFATAPPTTISILLVLWFQNWSWLLLILPLLVILLLFPTGRPPSPRWRWVEFYALATLVAFVLQVTFKQSLHTVDDRWMLRNPVGLIPDDPARFSYFIVPWLVGLGSLTTICAAALFVRYRRAPVLERLQIKWLLFAAALFVVIYVPMLIWKSTSQGWGIGDLANLILALSITLFPISIGVAILRYRLWDIDVIINRTLVYVPLTAIVAGIFSAVISLSQKVFVALTGQDSLASTVVATLIVVAVFNPIRDRVQKTVDKRFKEGPDPARRLSAFQEQLHNRVSEVAVGPITRRLLEEAVAAFDAEGGIAYVDEHGKLRPISTLGEWKGEEKLNVAVECSGARVAQIALSRRRDGREYAEPDRRALEQAAQAVARAIEEDGRLNHPQDPSLAS